MAQALVTNIPSRVEPQFLDSIKDCLNPTELPFRTEYELLGPHIWMEPEEIENLPGPVGWYGPGNNRAPVDNKYYQVNFRLQSALSQDDAELLKEKLKGFAEEFPQTANGSATFEFTIEPVRRLLEVKKYYSPKFRQAAQLLNFEPSQLYESFRFNYQPANVYSLKPSIEGEEPALCSQMETDEILGYQILIRVLEPQLQEHWSDFKELINFLQETYAEIPAQ